MSRLLNTIKWDIKFQAKYGLYLAGMVLTAVWVGVLSLFSGEALFVAVPLVLISDVSTMGLLFIGSILFFEKGQGSINAVITTPLKTSEYILSKVISLTLFVFLFTFVLVGAISIIKGITSNFSILSLAVLLIAVEYILGGFYLTMFFKTFTDFLLPMGLVFGFFSLPLLAMFNLEALEQVKNLFYLIPTHGLIMLLQGMFETPSWATIIYAVVYNGLVIYVLYRLCVKGFNTKWVGRFGDIDE